MSIVEQINEGIKEAMKKKDSLRLGVLRMLKSKILAVDARGNLSDNEAQKLFKTYAANLEEAQSDAQKANRPELIIQLESERRIVQEFLPKALTIDETKKLIHQAIKESGAKTKKDLGLVMKTIMKLNTAVDGKLAKDLASELLEE